ncbi:MAG: hypothetical protein ABSB59_36780, partial [Streptosporangiaceae bacterium]
AGAGSGSGAAQVVRGARATLERGPGHTEHVRQRRRGRRECTRHSTGTASTAGTATGTLTGKQRDTHRKRATHVTSTRLRCRGQGR